MADEHAHGAAQPQTTAVFSASVQPTHDGGWITVVHLGDGLSLTKWFPSEDEAHKYPEELAAWLSQGRE